ncbi:MAG: PIN domain-containing protein [Nanoarchaeota archaeon]
MFTIVLDTNIILDAIKFKVDLFQELKRICNFNYNVAILDKTLDELKDKKNSKLALALIKKYKIKIIKTNQGYVDDILAKLNKNYIVATNDKGLKKLLKNKHYITLRQKKYLILENVL